MGGFTTTFRGKVTIMWNFVGGALLKIGEKAANWFPSKQERYRNKIDSIKRKMDALSEQENTTDNLRKYASLAAKLRVYESSIKNL